MEMISRSILGEIGVSAASSVSVAKFWDHKFWDHRKNVTTLRIEVAPGRKRLSIIAAARRRAWEKPQ